MIARLRLQCLTCLRLRPVRGDRSSRLLPRAGELRAGAQQSPQHPGLPVLQVCTHLRLRHPCWG